MAMAYSTRVRISPGGKGPASDSLSCADSNECHGRGDMVQGIAAA